MALTTVFVTNRWTLHRSGERACVSCDIGHLSDEDDRGWYEVRVSLNAERVYTRLWDTYENMSTDVDGALRDLLKAGWVADWTLGTAATDPEPRNGWC